MITIPFQSYPYFDEQITIDNVIYIFEFQWNTRGNFWSMTISDKNENILIAGVKLIKNFDLLTRYSKQDILPKGIFILLATNDSSIEVTYNDVASNVVSLIYLSETEVAQLPTIQ
jgi:hypothetical protein